MVKSQKKLKEKVNGDKYFDTEGVYSNIVHSSMLLPYFQLLYYTKTIWLQIEHMSQ
jgi:hypothetical protein